MAISHERRREADGAAAGPRLSVRNLGKAYETTSGTESLAVADVSFDIQDGELVSLVGPSGCGKTTVLKACAGLVGITTGTVDFEGSGRPAHAGRYGMVFQTPTLLPWSTILQNVLLPAKILHLDRRRADERGRELLELVGLGGAEDKYPGELSGGMQQRASMARALLHEPDLVFMDEPFGALDAITRDAMNDLLQRIQAELRQTVLFVTHSIQEAVWLSDRVIVMSRGPGRIVEEVEVPFARPRDATLVASEDFRSLELHLRGVLNESMGVSPTPDAKERG